MKAITKKKTKNPSLPDIPQKFSTDTVRSLSLDLGSQLGWAYCDQEDKCILSSDFDNLCGMVKLKEKNKELWAKRFIKLKSFLDKVSPNVIFYEVVRQRFLSNLAALSYGGLLATTLTWAAEHNVDTYPLEVGQIKKFATGSGNADKVAMIKAANKRYSLSLDPLKEKKYADIADAIHILAYGMLKHFNVVIGEK